MQNYWRTNYRGWFISYDPNRPVTGTYRAERFGVGLCAGDEALLRRMIDAKENDALVRYHGGDPEAVYP